MKYTLEQLQELANQNKLAELDEICALTQGYRVHRTGQLAEYDGNGVVMRLLDYSPTTNKSQCFDLLEKLPLDIGRDSHGFKTVGFVNCGRPIRCTSERGLQIVVTIAAILVAQEGDK